MRALTLLSLSIVLCSGSMAAADEVAAKSAAAAPPNILVAMADDLSWKYLSPYGSKFVVTPACDRVAKSGVIFQQAFCTSPGCSPSRASLLAGKQPWQLAEAGTHASSFPKSIQVYPDILEQAGYFVGMTGKGWGPGKHEVSGWSRNPAGPAFSKRKLTPPQSGISGNDYAGNFQDFLAARPKGKPFCFWYGSTEPHLGYAKGSGLKQGKKLSDIEVPPFLPDDPIIRGDLADFAVEVEWFDRHLGLMLDELEKQGELANTIVVVLGDNGMPFPRAKANLYEYGFHTPMIISWPKRVPAGRSIDDLVSYVDLAPTFLAAAGLEPRPDMVGKSLLNVLTSDKQGIVDDTRTAVYAGRERHSSSRPQNQSYPARAVRTTDFLYIKNFAPDRWPAGDPLRLDGGVAYHDIDAMPTKDFMQSSPSPEIQQLFQLAVAKRPAEELFDLRTDPASIKNVAASPEYAEVKSKLAAQLEGYLRTTGDLRVLGGGEVWETYPRYSAIRKFPGDE